MNLHRFNQKRILPLVILSVLLCCAIAIGIAFTWRDRPSQPNNDIILLGFSQLGSESGWRLANTQDIVDASEKADNIGMMLYNANQSQTNQIKAIRSFIAYKVDMIAFSPIVESGWDAVLKQARQARIPVIIVDRNIDTTDQSLYACRVGSDFLSEGHKAGEYLLKKLDTDQISHVGVVEIYGTEKSSPGDERALGFRQIIGSDPRVEILGSRNGDFVTTKGRDAMNELLDTFGDQINVVFSHNDAMTYGAIEAIEQRGLTPGKDIIIISIDGEQRAIDLLRQGKINCIAECSPLQGDMLMDIVLRLKHGEKIEREYLMNETCFTEYDDLTQIAPRGY